MISSSDTRAQARAGAGSSVMAVSSWPLLLIFCLVGPGVIVSYILALKGASAAEIDDLFAGISVRLFTPAPAQGRASRGGARDKERGQQSRDKERRGGRGNKAIAVDAGRGAYPVRDPAAVLRDRLLLQVRCPA